MSSPSLQRARALVERPEWLGRPADPHVRPLPTDARDVEFLARLMDSAFRVPGLGIRFGLDSIIGLLPGVGDAATSLVSLYILAAASRYAVAPVTQLRMALNIGIDAVLGAVPIVGDLFDVYWKANIRNVELLRRHLEATTESATQLRRRDRMFVIALILVVCALLLASAVTAFFIVAWLASLLFRLFR